MNKFYISLVSLMVVVGTVVSLGILGGTVNAKDRYCDTNSIISCGALDAPELNQRYNANATGDLPAIYNHYGISSGMVAAVGTAKVGQVGKNGEVKVDGKVIATNAQSVGRHYVAGSTAININGKKIYQRATQSVFIDEWQNAFVFQKADGSFASAIIMSCGNPVTATPTPKPKPPLVYNCTGLTATKITRTQFDFKATRTVKNVRYIRTDFIVRNSTGKEIFRVNDTDGVYKHTQSQVGKFTVEAQIIVDVNGKEAASPVGNCKKAFEVKQVPPTPEYCTVPGKEHLPKDSPECIETPPVTPPVTPPTPPVTPVAPEAPVELPKTGAADAIAPLFGLGSLIASAGYYIASRRATGL